MLAAFRGRHRPHHDGRPDRRSAPELLDPYRHGMPLPARPGWPGPLAHLIGLLGSASAVDAIAGMTPPAREAGGLGAIAGYGCER
jgi:hypothetical protein